jgi:general L-amino acid transport system substrate-binding protein
MVEAEELKISSATVDQQKANTNPAVRRLLGMEGDLGKNLGLKPDWALQVIKQVGSYQEIFERNLGANTPLKIARGQNALWRDGGLQYSMPFR